MFGKVFVLLLLGTVALEAFPQTHLSQKENILRAEDDLREISNYDLIQEIEQMIIKLLKEMLGQVTEKVKQCIEASMPEIKELAGQLLNDVKQCISSGGGLQCIKDVITANKDKVMALFNKVKTCVTSLEDVNEREISTDDLIQEIEKVIVELLKKLLGEITEKVKQCLQASMPEIKEIASQMLSEVKECISGGGGFQCIQQVVNANMDKVKGVLNKIKACATSLEDGNEPDGVITDVIMKIIVDLIKKWLVNISAKALECIKTSMPEIKDIAGQMVNDVKACMANGGSIFHCAQEVVNANKDKVVGVFNKIKSCITALEENDDNREISNYNIIEVIKEKIIEMIKKLVGTSQQVVHCIQQVMPDINALATAIAQEVQQCMAGGVNIIQCAQTIIEQNKQAVLTIVNNVKSCLSSFNDVLPDDIIQEIKDKIIEMIKKLLGTSEKVVQCIEKAMPEINALATETANEIQTCIANGGNMMQCAQTALSNMMVKVKAIIEEVKTCINA